MLNQILSGRSSIFFPFTELRGAKEQEYWAGETAQLLAKTFVPVMPASFREPLRPCVHLENASYPLQARYAATYYFERWRTYL